jgi:hypothetical protein
MRGGGFSPKISGIKPRFANFRNDPLVAVLIARLPFGVCRCKPIPAHTHSGIDIPPLICSLERMISPASSHLLALADSRG